MMVKDKTRDIAVLRTIGAGAGSILRIFLMCGAFVGVAGTAAGALLGICSASTSSASATALQSVTGTNLFNPEVYFLSQLPADCDWREVLQVVLMALASACWRRCTRAGAPRAPIRWRRCAMSDALGLRGVRRTYRSGGGALTVLSSADLALGRARSWPWSAPSGAGKSTLLHLAGLLEKPDGGAGAGGGRDAGALSDAERTAIRRDSIGFVYQFHHLLAEFTALENVVMPQMIAGTPRREAAGAGAALLARLGLRSGRATSPASCPAASSSAWRSPARSPTRRACCWPTSPPATSTRAPPAVGVRRTAGDRARAGRRRADRHPQPGARRAHGPRRDPARRQGGAALGWPYDDHCLAAGVCHRRHSADHHAGAGHRAGAAHGGGRGGETCRLRRSGDLRRAAAGPRSRRWAWGRCWPPRGSPMTSCAGPGSPIWHGSA